jgi:hypothetical protein
LEKYFVVEDEDLDIELEFVLNYFGTYQNKQKLHIPEHWINFYVPE